MQKIGILTDTACDLEAGYFQQEGVKVLPLKIIYGETEYLDRVTIQPDEVYGRMPEEVATTSMPSVAEVLETFEEFKKEGYTHILSIHLSSGLSGTYGVVEMAAAQAEGIVVKVIDTKTLSMAQGFIVEHAKKWVDEGVQFEELISKVTNLMPKTKVFYVLETLEYLRRGGRIGAVSASLGQILDLKPIITLDTGGKYYTHVKARGRKKSVTEIYRLAKKALDEGAHEMAVMHGGALEEGKELLNRIQAETKLPLRLAQISPALGVHTGPGLLGIVYVEK